MWPSHGTGRRLKDLMLKSAQHEPTNDVPVVLVSKKPEAKSGTIAVEAVLWRAGAQILVRTTL